MANLGKIFAAELLGTFVFLGVIMHVVGKNEDMGWLKIGLALAVAILLFGSVSGGKFNPAVSFMFLIANKTPATQFTVECVAQLVGAVGALFLYRSLLR
jgi:aquaporin Z